MNYLLLPRKILAAFAHSERFVSSPKCLKVFGNITFQVFSHKIVNSKKISIAGANVRKRETKRRYFKWLIIASTLALFA